MKVEMMCAETSIITSDNIPSITKTNVKNSEYDSLGKNKINKK